MAHPPTQSSSAIAAQIVLAFGCAAAVGAIAAVKCPESRHFHLQGICLRVPWFVGGSHDHSPATNSSPTAAVTRSSEAHPSDADANLGLRNNASSKADRRVPASTLSGPSANYSRLSQQRPWDKDMKAAGRLPRFTPERASPFWTSDSQPPSPVAATATPSVQPASHVRPVTAGPKEVEPPRLEELYARLEAMGATVLRLEKQQAHPPRYRFRCEAPLPSSPHFSRFFQAFDAEPVKAVQHVLADVEAWRKAPGETR